ncbi:MAG: hypothetical protein ACR2H5_09275 [Ktedonobacteraceae bacterium]
MFPLPSVCPKKGVGGPCTIRKLSEVYYENTDREKLAPPKELSGWWYLTPVFFPIAMLFVPIPKRTKLFFVGGLVVIAVLYGIATLLTNALNGTAIQSQTPLVTTHPFLATTIIIIAIPIIIIMLAWQIAVIWLFYRGLIDLQKRIRELRYIWNTWYYCTTHGCIVDPI